MKRILQPYKNVDNRSIQFFLALLFCFTINTVIGQQIDFEKVVTQSTTECNQFDVTLSITGNPPPQPQEVVLIIDRSGSMDDGPVPEPIDYAKDAAIDFVNNIFDPVNNPTGLNKVAVVSYSSSATLDIELSDSSDKQDVIDAINDITTSGATNIQDGIVKADQEIQKNGTFDCATSRSIILLTDGVTNRDNNGNACSNTEPNSICQQNAIQAGIDAQTYEVSGITYLQNIFSVGLFSAIEGTEQNIATNTIDQIQNSGLYTTENNADLSGIYMQILGQLVPAATSLTGEPLVIDTVGSGFTIDNGSITASKGTVNVSGQEIQWFVNDVRDETITLSYSVDSTDPNSCGLGFTGNAVIKYQDTKCIIQEETFDEPEICVPCPDVQPSVVRQGCTNSFDYSSNVDQMGCSPVTENFFWEFFLNGVSVGSSNQANGTFQYTGAAPLSGEFTAQLSYDGSYGAGCLYPTVSAESILALSCGVDGWAFECGDDKLVDEYGYNANCNTTNTAAIPDPASIYQYVVEIVYKGANPGETLQFTDEGGITHTLNRSVPVGTSSSIWVYRGLIAGNTGSITYNTTGNLSCNLQSLVVYAFRNVVDASSSSGIFTSRSGVNDVQTIDITIPSFTGPRNLMIETPISELTEDGRYLLLKAEAGGIMDQTFIFSPDPSLPGGTCCLAIPMLTLNAVPGNVTTVTITVDSRNNENGQTVNGQSWVIASGVNVDSDCYEVLDLALDNKVDILCNGEDTGEITVVATGGVPPYTYSLNGGTPQASATFSGLTAGVYTVSVEDSLGNEDSISVTLEEPEAISIQITKINASQTGGCTNGEATATPSGGVPPYSYQWSASAGNQTTQTAVNLPSGTHTVVVTDVNGCTLEQGVVIDCVDDCDQVISVDDITNVLCAGDMTGSATVSASSAANPTATFTFTWNTNPQQIDSGVTTSTISNLSAGVYTVSVTIDGTQCLPVDQSVTITEPANALTVTATSTDEVGPMTGDGTATANPSGGTPPYTYEWSPGGETTQTITGLSAGTYTVTVTDANGCTAMASTVVNPGSCQNLSASASATPVSCNGGYDGTATVGVTGGIGPFTYLWSNGETTQTITGLPAGTYTVTVKDSATLCEVTSTATVNEPGALSSGIAVTNVGCFGESTGSLDLTVSGGTPPYTFLWNPGGETTEDLFNLSAGTYSLLITDANGCTLNDSATVLQPSESLSLIVTSQTDIVCNNPSSVTVQASGGTPAYSYSVDGGTPQASGTFDGLDAGDHIITATDANGCQTDITVTILKNCTVAVDDINDTLIDTAVNGNVLTNDYDLEGDTQTVSTPSVITAQGVTVNIDPTTGAYSYTPPAGFTGEDTFEYEVCDNGNPIACDTATVYIEVLPDNGSDNDPPVANADTNTTQKDNSVDGNVLPNDFDPDGDPIAVTGNTQPANGMVTVNPDGSYTYTPNAGYVGQDTFEYTICDNGTPQLCDTATVTIQVLDTQDNITTAVDDAYFTTEGLAINANVLDNDTDPEGNNQAVDTAISPSNGPSNGTLVLNADGSFTYTPNAGYFGPDSFVYSIFDDGSPVATDKATVTILVGTTGNDILAVDDINDTFVDLSVSGDVSTNDINTDGPAGTEVFTITSNPSNGTLIFNADGTYTYTPNPGYIGEDTFEYRVCDGGNPIACDTATVYIEVVDDPVIGNDPPVANADTNTTLVDIPVSGNVLSNDFDPDGDMITVTSNTQPANGMVTVNPDGSYNYTPNAGFEGEDTFEYTICDDGTPQLCDTAKVIIQVIRNNGNITVANDDAYFGEVGQPVAGNVLDNDSDPEGNSQFVDTVITPVSGPSNGTLVINPDGSFTYTPNAGFMGTDQFVYEIFDNGSPVARDRGTVYILIQQTPAPAIAIVKTGVVVDTNQNQCTDEGETIDYTFTVTNEGNVALQNVSVTDPLLGGAIPGPDSGDTDGDGELDVDETWIYIATYTITQADIDLGQVENQATAEGTDEDGNNVYDLSDDNSVLEDDPTETSLCQNPAIALIKTGTFSDGNGDQCADPDEVIVYFFTVTNEGNVSLSNINLTDSLLNTIVFIDGDTNNDGILQIDETWNYTSDYNITQDDIDAGQVTNQATVEGTTPGGDVVSDLSDDNSVLEDDPTVTDLCQEPSIDILKTAMYDDGGDCSQPGEVIDYTFTVTNTGNVSISNVVVEDPLLGGAVPGPDSGDDDNDGELDVTETWIYTGSYAITQADIDAGSVTNTATVTGVAPDQSTVTDSSDAVVTALCQNPAIALIKTGVFKDGNGNQCADPGETIDYSFEVVNTGNVTLTDVTVTDPLVAVTGGPIILAPGASDTMTFSATYVITQADIDAGSVTNQATAEGTTPGGGMVSDLSDDDVLTEDDPTIVVLCQATTIALIKTGVFIDGNGNQCADAGETIDYSFEVVNTGNVTLTDVTVTDPLVAVTGGPIILAPGASDTTTFSATYTITQADIDAGSVTNQATAEGTTPGGGMVSDLSDDDVLTEDDPTVVALCQNPAIALIKTGVFIDGNGNQCADPGETIDYSFEVVNTGNVTLTDVTVTDPLVAVTGGPIILAPGASDTMTFSATYTITQADIDAGSVTNQATAEGTTPGGGMVSDLSDDDVLTEDDPTVVALCQNPAIALIKTGVFIDGNGNQCADPGETIDYSFEVVNTGNVTLTDVTVTDPLVAVTGGPIILAPGASDTTTFSATYVITQADIDAGSVTNQATAEGTTPGGGMVSDLSDDDVLTEDDPTVVALCQSPAIALIKTGVFIDGNGNQCADAGETIDYSFEVVNTGNVTLTDVTVTDPLVAVTGGPIILAPGASDTTTFSATYVITQADIDAGSVTNQATAEGTTPGGGMVSDLSDDDVLTEDDPTVVALCQNPAIALIKTGVFIDGNGNQCADAGETIDYSFEVVNTGNVTLTDVTVTDPLVAVTGGPIILAPGASDTTTFSATYVITQADIDAGSVTNQATAEGTTPGGGMVSDLSDDDVLTEDDPTVVALCQNPAIALIKTGVFIDGNGNQCADPGETIEYSFEVVNTGNVTLTNIFITDPLVIVSGLPSSLAPGESDTTTFSATYVITQADIDAGSVTNQATAEGTTPSGGTVSDLSDDDVLTEDDPTVVALCQNPAIALIKTGVFIDGNGNQCADPGETIDYSFEVVNTGNVTLTDVTVTDPLVAVTGGPIILAPGASDTTTFSATYVITQADIDAGSVTNQATAEGTTPGGGMVSDLSDDDVLTEDDPTVVALCQNPAIALIKTGVFIDGNGNQCADPGETIEYSFEVVNTGNVTLTDVTVTDPLVAVTGGPIILAPGASDTTTFSATYVITQADIDAGSVTNQATAEGTTPGGGMVSDLSDDDVLTEDDPTVVDLCQEGSIALIKVGTFNDENGDGCADVDETISYAFSVLNNGNVTLTDITVTDPLVAVNGGPITLAPGAQDDTTFTAVYSITQADIDNGQVENQATAEGTTPSGGTVSDLSDDNSFVEDDPTITELCQEGSIALIKTGTFNDENGNGCAEVDETISYAFEVFNTGNVTLTDVTVTDPLVNVVGGPIVLQPGESDAISFTAEYAITQQDIDNGFVVNQAEAMGTTPSGNTVTDLSDDDSILEDDPTITELCQDPVIALIKVGTPTDENGNGCVDVGETIVYSFEVANLGNVELTNVIVTDPLVNVQGGPITLAVGETDTDSFTAVYTATQDDVDAGLVSNQATAEGIAPDGTVVTDQSDNDSFFEDDPTLTELCQEPALSIEKSGEWLDENGDGIPQEGETIFYTFKVTNIGNVTLFNIDITDDLPGIQLEGGPIPQLEPGEFDDSTFTATYAINSGDIEANEVVNQAIGTATDANGIEVSDPSDDPNDPTNIDPDGDGEPDDPTVVILPEIGAAFEIFNGITPDGDGLNDFFRIVDIESFPVNNMKIFNRWGVLVWETDGYGGSSGEDNVFRGISDGRATIRQGEELPTGTYYYILSFPAENPGQSSYTGYLYINR